MKIVFKKIEEQIPEEKCHRTYGCEKKVIKIADIAMIDAVGYNCHDCCEKRQYMQSLANLGNVNLLSLCLLSNRIESQGTVLMYGQSVRSTAMR